jgi:RnfABCDGE-type electron transport complex B subunit
MAVTGALFGAGLALASHKLAVKVDPRVVKVRDVLPGANCGACGFPGCDGLADAIVLGKSAPDACPVGGAECAEAIASIMGLAIDLSAERKVAQIKCGGGKDVCQERSVYVGIEDCKAAVLAGDGAKACSFGCLGLGTCVRVCPFDAMKMGEDGLPIVDEDKCTACGKCVAECPRKIIELVGLSKKVHVRCKNTQRGAAARKICKVACIGCQACVRVCPTKAIQVENFLAFIDYDLCDNCGACVEKCPTKAIEDTRKRAAEQAAS